MNADVIVVGGGIAGVSAAAELSEWARVILIESEAQCGYHATGRSAAYFAPAYGNATVRAVSALSEPFFRQPPEGFSETPLIRSRDALFIGRQDQAAALRTMAEELDSLHRLDRRQVCGIVPILSDGNVASGLLDTGGGDLDVDALVQGYLKLFRQRGGQLITGSPVVSLMQRNGQWIVTTSTEKLSAPTLINAAGAWADSVAGMAGLDALGIVPKRRTALLIDAPTEHISDWPLTIDIDENFYFKPDAGQLLISPADETSSPPCDAQPDDIDIAIAIDRFQAATGIEVAKVNHRWAGLRSFAPDRTFVVGMDPRTIGFFWLAGQGGYGVQSAPAMAKLVNYLVTGSLPGGYESLRQLAPVMSPARLI